MTSQPKRARRTSGRIRHAIAAVAAMLTLFAVAGCAAIPTTGAVMTGGKIGDKQPSGFDYRPDGPTKGASQQDILRQFIEAATGSQDNYGVAREFLSSRFAQKWNPRQSVTIRSGSGSIARSDDNELSYTLTSSATVDATGEYTQSVRPASSTLTFRFAKENGQWRISYAPDGIVLSPVSFSAVFEAHALYFYDPTYRYLVPDERWFLSRSSASTRIVSALVAGPSDWLKGAVVSAFPEGTQLSINAVTVDNGAAQVDLTSDALKATTIEKARMRQQLTASLSGVASVSSVDITVEGTAVSIPESESASVQRDPDVDARPFVQRGGDVGFAAAGSGSIASVAGLGAKIAGLHPSSIALAASGNEAAVGNTSGAWVVRTGSVAPIRVDSRSGLIAPSIDDQGFVWSGQSSSGSSIEAFGSGGDEHRVASSLPSGKLVSFAISRDSTRALALLDTDSGAALYVMSIIRGSDKVPTVLGAPVRIQAASGTPVGAAWTSDRTVASLGRTASGSTVVTTTVGGESTSLPHPDGLATSVVGGSGDMLLLRMSDGSVVSQTGSGWDATGITADVLGVQR